MRNAWKLIEQEAYERARKQALTHRVGRPTRSDWILWQKELELIAASFDVSDTYEWTVDADGNNLGCVALAVDPEGDEYELRFGITTYVAPTKPPDYDTTIDINTPTYLRKRLEEENEQKKHDYFTWKGASRGMAENLCDAMDKQYYDQLEHSIIGMKNVTTLQIMKHLDTVWVPMTTKEKRRIKADYYKAWDVASGVSLSAFTKALNERKIELIQHNITIEEEDMMEHYMVQMYASNAFSKADMKEWEQKSELDRDDWTVMQEYFRDKMTLNEAYNNNNEGNAATLYGSSANIIEEQENILADMGDQIREYIQQITVAKEKENVPPPSNNASTASSNKAVEEMNKRMTKIEELLLNMTFANNQNIRNRGGGGNDDKNRGGGGNDNNNNNNNNNNRRRMFDPSAPYTKYRNMGVYCHSCGFHPVGLEHTSITCGFKRQKHDDNATWTNRGVDGSTLWPTRVRDDQKNHASYAGKSAPTN
jgi:hypothetical protein